MHVQLPNIYIYFSNLNFYSYTFQLYFRVGVLIWLWFLSRRWFYSKNRVQKLHHKGEMYILEKEKSMCCFQNCYLNTQSHCQMLLNQGNLVNKYILLILKYLISETVKITITNKKSGHSKLTGISGTSTMHSGIK